MFWRNTLPPRSGNTAVLNNKLWQPFSRIHGVITQKTTTWILTTTETSKLLTENSGPLRYYVLPTREHVLTSRSCWIHLQAVSVQDLLKAQGKALPTSETSVSIYKSTWLTHPWRFELRNTAVIIWNLAWETALLNILTFSQRCQGTRLRVRVCVTRMTPEAKIRSNLIREVVWGVWCITTPIVLCDVTPGV